MAATITDKLRKGAAAFATTLSAQKAAAAASASLSTSVGIPTTTAIEITVGRVDAAGNKTPATKAIYKGLLSGTTVSSLVLIEGTDQLHAAGTPVEIVFTASQWNDMIDWALVQHNQDGTHGAITATSVASAGAVSGTTGNFTGGVTESGFTLQTLRGETSFDFVASGCVITATGPGTTLGWSMTAGVVYIGGKRLTVASASGTVTASRDTYFDLLDPGSGTVAALVNTGGNIVTNNAASPALAASSVRIGIVVSAATITAQTSVNQGQETMLLPIASSVPYAVTDSLGNLICPRDSTRRMLGYKQILSSFTTTSTTGAQVTGLSAPVQIPATRKAVITVYCLGLSTSVVSTNYGLSVWDGTVGSGTQLQASQFNNVTGGGSSANEVVPLTLVTPPVTLSAGLHTINVGGFTASGTLTAAAASGAAFLVRVDLY